MTRLLPLRVFRHAVALLLPLLMTFAMTLRKSQAQAIPTASRPFSFSVFGAGSRNWTAYTQVGYGTDDSGYGYIAGADFTRSYRGLQPSLEFRYGYGTNSTVSEDTIQGGLKVAKVFGPARRFRPYAEATAGYGTINFKHPLIYATGPYTSDNSALFAFGAGLDYDLTYRFALKADFQYQFWKLGTEQSTLTPTSVSVGLVYRIPFGR